MATMSKRISGMATKYNIKHPCFIINWDQTAVLLMQASHYTYSDKKDKQVPIVGKEEKRQITAVVTSTLGGDLLPMQLIFKGQDKNKRKKKATPKIDGLVDTARLRGWHLTQTPNHWSNLGSMKDFVEKIIVKWVEAKARELKLKVVDTHCILLIDCWSVHTGQEFRGWMKTHYPNYHLTFVPAGCTSKAQPADVILQRPLKAGIINSFNSWMTEEITHLIILGAKPEEVRVDTGMVKLKSKLVMWMWDSWRRLKDRETLIVKGWEKCGLGDVLEAENRVEGMRLCMEKPEEEVGVEEDQEAAEVDSDVEDEKDAVEDEEVEEMMDACLRT